jgi:hypothetical protein
MTFQKPETNNFRLLNFIVVAKINAYLKRTNDSG